MEDNRIDLPEETDPNPAPEIPAPIVPETPPEPPRTPRLIVTEGVLYQWARLAEWVTIWVWVNVVLLSINVYVIYKEINFFQSLASRGGDESRNWTLFMLVLELATLVLNVYAIWLNYHFVTYLRRATQVEDNQQLTTAFKYQRDGFRVIVLNLGLSVLTMVLSAMYAMAHFG